MTTDPFETALVTSALSLAAEKGWGQFGVQDAARAADLSETEARRRFSCKTGITLALGRMADDAALADEAGYGSTRERLFDLLMRRLDVFQAHRPGVRACLKPCRSTRQWFWPLVPPHCKACARLLRQRVSTPLADGHGPRLRPDRDLDCDIPHMGKRRQPRYGPHHGGT